MVDFSCLALALFFDDSKTAARRLWGKVDCVTESRKPVTHDSRCQQASEVVGFQNIYIPEI